MASNVLTMPSQARIFAASSKASPVAARRSVVVRATSSAPQESFKIQRRSLAALLAAVLPVGNAFALIPDDDDEELIEKARASRKAKLAGERQTEKAFARSAGFADSSTKKELVPLQLGINAIAKTGSQLAAGDVQAAASTLNGSWVGAFKQAGEDLSFNDASKSSLKSLVSELSSLQTAASRGSLDDAKKSFVAVVGAVQKWSTAADLTSNLKGI